jgi:hypothetical protein
MRHAMANVSCQEFWHWEIRGAAALCYPSSDVCVIAHQLCHALCRSCHEHINAAAMVEGGEGTCGCFSGAAGWYFQLDTSTAAQYFHSWVVVCAVCAPLMHVCKPSSAWVHLVKLLFQSCFVACAIAGFPIQLDLTDLGPRHAEGDELVRHGMNGSEQPPHYTGYPCAGRLQLGFSPPQQTEKLPPFHMPLTATATPHERQGRV